MTSQVFEYERVILDSHIDLYGHVNNAKYLEIMEEARWHIARRNGLTAESVMAKKIGPVILEINIKFKHELKLGEKIKVLCTFQKPQGKIGHIEQWILDESGQEAARAIFAWALFDLNARKIIDFTPEWRAALGF